MEYEQNNSPNWADHLDQILQRAWACLGQKGAPQSVAEGISQGRLASLATIGPDGGPELRTVMLRSVDQARGLIDIHTDNATPKLAEIRANPKVGLLLWRTDLNLQLRLKGRAEILTGADAAPLWRDVPEAARPNYGVMPAPGSEIAAPGDFTREPDAARFAVLRISVEAMDAVILAEPQHRRAFYERRDGWRGVWRAP